MNSGRAVVGDSQSLVLEARTSVSRAATALGGGDSSTANLHLFAALQALGGVVAGTDGVADSNALLLLRSRLVGVRMSQHGDKDAQLRYLERVRDALDGLK